MNFVSSSSGNGTSGGLWSSASVRDSQDWQGRPQCASASFLRHSAALLALIFLNGLITYQAAAQTKENKSVDTSAEKLPTLTTAKEIHDLSLFDAKRRYPVHLQAFCLFCFPDWHGFFAHDGVSGIFVEQKNQALLGTAIHPGVLLDIVGVTGPGDYSPIVDQATLRVIGERPLPPARLVSIDRLTGGAEDGQWLAFEGIVRSARINNLMVDFVISSGRLQIEVGTARNNKTDFSWLVHARVRVSGSTGPIFNQRGQIIGMGVYSPSLDYLQILQPPPADPFSIPLSPVNRVYDYTPGSGSEHPVRIRGVVTARWGKTVFITDGDHSASILNIEMTTLKPGDVVEAVGYPSLGDASHTMEDAIFKQLGTAPLPLPRSVSAADALSGNYEGDLIRLNGRLIGQQEATDQTTLLIDTSGAVFSAVLPRGLKEQSLINLRNGSRIQLTGICVISETKASRNYRLPTGFQILLRSPEDVVVLEKPTWWTPVHAALVLALALTGTLGVLVWVMFLRRRLQKQTKQMREQADLLREQTQQLRESEERFRHMALHDNLTGLATRLLLQDRMDVAMESARRHKTGLTLLMVDLDKFKEINDTFGHQAGDEVLRVTANRLLEAVRKSDTVARIGGDEFIVLFSELSDAQIAERTAGNMVKTLAAPIAYEGRDLPVSVSIGVCTNSGVELDADALLKNADEALYRAKAGGRDCYRVFTPGKND
jgi:diguanylate cyclase (GGDEF)-like protein